MKSEAASGEAFSNGFACTIAESSSHDVQFRQHAAIEDARNNDTACPCAEQPPGAPAPRRTQAKSNNTLTRFHGERSCHFAPLRREPLLAVPTRCADTKPTATKAGDRTQMRPTPRSGWCGVANQKHAGEGVLLKQITPENSATAKNETMEAAQSTISQTTFIRGCTIAASVTPAMMRNATEELQKRKMCAFMRWCGCCVDVIVRLHGHVHVRVCGCVWCVPSACSVVESLVSKRSCEKRLQIMGHGRYVNNKHVYCVLVSSG